MRNTTLVLKPVAYQDIPPVPPTPTNEALLLQIHGGDGTALCMLYRRLYPVIQNNIARMGLTEDACDDVIRELFEGIRDGVIRYSPEFGRALGWMLTRARGVAKARLLGARQLEPQPEQERSRRPLSLGYYSDQGLHQAAA
jgi:hypothetical protein